MEDLTGIQAEGKSELHNIESLIEENSQFILRCASVACKRYISKSDDEWSVALIAFTQSVQDYRADLGDFLPFAQLVIRRRLTDYFRAQSRHSPEIPADPQIFETGPLEESPQPALQDAVSKKLIGHDPEDLRLEIESAGQIFSGYGFSFFDLASCSPKALKTKTACAKAVADLLKNPLLLYELRSSKQLPIKLLEKNTQVPRKILDRHRKYIIAAAEILSGEYPCLAEYMRFIREELNR